MTEPTPQPTEKELEIIRVLWAHGPATVREVLDTLRRDHDIGYTTVLKLLQIMHDKGLVERDESSRTHIYRAKIHEKQTQRRYVRDLIDRAFDGSVPSLVMSALSAKKASPEDLVAIREMLDRLEKRKDDES